MREVRRHHAKLARELFGNFLPVQNAAAVSVQTDENLALAFFAKSYFDHNDLSVSEASALTRLRTMPITGDDRRHDPVVDRCSLALVFAHPLPAFHEE